MFVMIQSNNFRDDLTDIPALTETLVNREEGGNPNSNPYGNPGNPGSLSDN